MTALRFALFGAGFWANYQLPGWIETGLVECVAICDPSREKAQALADQWGVPRVYTSPDELLANETLDFVDICVPVETHVVLARTAADRGLNVVCQKPLAPSLEEAADLITYCEEKGVMLLVNENWRWQDPLRRLKAQLETGAIGTPFRARIDYRNSFPVFDNQPFLKTLKQFIITDMGTHILDAARFLFGEAVSLTCHMQTIHKDIQGEDVATIMLKMASGATVIVEMSYASPREHDRFPEVYVEVEGDQGFLELGPDFWIRQTSSQGTLAMRDVPHHYAWANPEYDLVHTSIVTCQTNLARALAGLEAAETTGADNLKTLTLVYKAYDSAASGQNVGL
jgi:D-apiose dehydrogenase